MEVSKTPTKKRSATILCRFSRGRHKRTVVLRTGYLPYLPLRFRDTDRLPISSPVIRFIPIGHKLSLSLVARLTSTISFPMAATNTGWGAPAGSNIKSGSENGQPIQEEAIFDLNNPIHPIFARANFEDAEIVGDVENPDCLDSDLEYFQGSDYEAIRPALMLASRLISTPCVLDYWYAVLCTEPLEIAEEGTEEQEYLQKEAMERGIGDVEMDRLEEPGPGKIYSKDAENFEVDSTDLKIDDAEDDDDSSEESYNGAIFRKCEPLDETDVTQVKSLLDVLAENVVFRRCKMDRETPAGTQMQDEQASTGNVQVKDMLQGSKSMVRIDTDRHDRICSLYRETIRSSTGKYPSELLDLYFHFAVALVHELAHVAHFARFGTVYIPFEDNGVSENGFDWENFVFGGLLYEHQPVLYAWPNKQIKRDVSDGITEVRETNSDVIKYWGFPSDFVLRFFQTEFWEKTVKQKGAEALKVPKDVEYTVTRERYRGEPDPHQ